MSTTVPRMEPKKISKKAVASPRNDKLLSCSGDIIIRHSSQHGVIDERVASAERISSDGT